MSETLPPICREGVVLRFVFPFDASLSRTASVFWRSTHPKVDTWYADITQGGESSIVHEQVTFPGDAWVVYVQGSPDKVLAYHVATGEREQQVIVAGEVAARVEQPHEPLTTVSPSALTAAEQEDDELAAAIRESLIKPRGATTFGGSSAAAAAAAVGRRERQEILEAADPVAAAAALLGSRMRPNAPQPVETGGAGGTGVPSAAAAEAEGDASLSRAVALSREVAVAHRAVEAARRSWQVAAAEGEVGVGGGCGASPSTEARVRLQLTLPDGTRSTHAARHDTSLRSVLALACWQLGAHLGLPWVAEQQHAAQDTHALVCTHPRLRFPFHLGGIAAFSAGSAGPEADLDADLTGAGLAPSAALRIVSLYGHI